MKIWTAALAALVVAAAPPGASAQTAAPASQTQDVREAAFALYRDKIVLPVQIGGRTFTGVYDSGAERSLLAQAAADELGADLSGRSVLKGFAGETQGRLARDVSIAVGGARHTFAVLPVADLSAFTPRFGRRIDFILGVDAFAGDVVEVDWTGGRLRWTPRARYTPPPGSRALAFDRSRGLYRTTITVNGRESPANIDLGDGSPLTLSARFAARAGVQGATTVQITGIGGDAIFAAGSAGTVDFAGAVHADAPATIQPTSPLPGGVDVNIGLPLLMRYDLAFDYGSQRAWVTPAPARAAQPFLRDVVGLRVSRAQADRLKVLHVNTPGPAAAAGFVGGEEILAIDGTPIAAWTADTDIAAWLKAPQTGAVRLSLADGREITVQRARHF